MTNLDLKELARTIHINAKRKGFYDDATNKHFEEHQLYEIAKEIGEMHEAFKKNRFAAELNGKETIESFEADIKDTFEDEMADIVIRCLDYMHWAGLNIYDPADYKLRKNTSRLNEKYVISALCFETTEDVIKGRIYDVYSMIFSLAFAMDIDLDKHIIAKMEYNKQRARLHGKAF